MGAVRQGEKTGQIGHYNLGSRIFVNVQGEYVTKKQKRAERSKQRQKAPNMKGKGK
jgi:hypothetical protein